MYIMSTLIRKADILAVGPFHLKFAFNQKKVGYSE